MDGLDVKVLIVEDEQASQRALQYLLSVQGYETDAVGSAEQAIDWIRTRGQFDMVLVDVDLPGKTGLQFLEDLAELNPNAKPILLTALARDRVSSATRQGIPYLRKPIDFERLLTILSDCGQPH